ncbi:prepilin peptidase [Gammaproteobacteria bacterium]|jgi:prepilin signal peptidase PulO-like enzyme (type II secretory pathway)|nr:prepilin peptidase [Gammaproteobacteria bacterium]MDB2339391.1 prepilin peptidase [Gammaproteobacteria bacterium]MDC0332396.1 prepilin peptidase [Gammaproteobacteria bacterium]
MELVLTNLLLIALGGCLGSFASLLIYRLPLEDNEINIFKPRSFCPHCKSQLSIIQLIPFMGYLYSRGICLACNAKINRLYIFNELIITAFILFIFSKLALANISSWLIVLIIISLYIQSIIDLQTLHLFQPISAILILSGLILNISLEFFTVPLDSFLGLIFGYGILFCINEVYKMIRSKDGIGSGDFLLLGGIGSIFGASAIGPILLIGSSITLCLYAINKDKELPLGFGLAIGAIFYCFLFLALSIK